MVQPSGVDITPKLIIEHVVAVLHANILEGFDSSFVPNVFVVYLPPRDMERLRALESRIREQAVRALHKELSGLNRTGPKLPLIKSSAKRHEALGDWVIEFRPNLDEDASRDPILVHAEIRDDTGKVAAPSLLDGNETIRAKAPAPDIDGAETRRSGPVRQSALAGTVYATLRFEDDTGVQTFSMTKDLIKAGRGGRDYLVDLKLVSKKDISQEHFQIRRDPATSKFFIKDLSRYGTWVNGKRVQGSIDRTGPELRDLHIEEALPEVSTISLADVLSLQFKAPKKR